MDDLLDLNWSDQPKQSTAPSRHASSNASRRATPNPTFDFLSKPSSSNGQGPNYYSSGAPPVRVDTPKTAPLPSQPRASTPAARSQTPQAPPPSTGTDAFSSLLSLGDGPSGSAKTLSLADKQRQIAEEKRRKEEHEKQQFTAHGSFWDSLGSSSTAASSTSHTPALQENQPRGLPAPASMSGSGDLDDLLSPQPVRRTEPNALRQAHTPTPPLAAPQLSAKPGEWEDDDTFLTTPSQQPSRATASPSDPFDFDSLNGSLNGLAPPRGGKGLESSSSGARTPLSNFDGDERGTLGTAGFDDEDDLLGELGRPVKSRAARAKSPRRSEKLRDQAPRSVSPPPHLVMQIMEMGYTPSQARSALAQTPTGLDVQAAVDILLTAGPNDHDVEPQFEDPDVVLRERQRREEEEVERRRRRRAGPSRSSITPRTKDEQRQQEEARGEYGEQAEKIIAQASEIGQSFLKNATTFWNSGKEKALRMYEEQRKALEAEQAATKGKGRERKDGRPRWMVEAEEQGGGRDERSTAGGFKDSDEEDHRVPASRPVARDQTRTQEPAASKQRQRGETRRSDNDLLGGGDAPKSYQPASRHRVAGRNATASPRHPPQPAEPQPLPKRNLVEASSSQIQHSLTHKAKGNEHFKLGRFAEAESAYTTAISSLPDGHLFLVPIYNNRAAARIKLGESASAAEDCSVVITIIGPTYHPAKEAPLPPDHAEVKLGDALVKATTKRAQAWEMAEKWAKALEDWERVLGFDAALLGGAASSTRSLASEGIRRSRKMLEPPKEESSTQSGSSRPPPKPSQPIRTAKLAVSDPGKSKAVGELRKANQAAEAEEAQRMAAKDSVDAKILAWKGGKETNLRALIASLDTVLWDEILSGGLKVGMHELITEKQVKIKYMKVIARLHPDKLDVKKTTVEQRMLANAVFSSLNDAWQAFNNP